MDKALINKLFETLKTIFPAWRQAFKTQKEVDLAKQQWVIGFLESGITDWSMVEGGLKKARQSDSDFMPSIGRFVKWCRESALQSIGIESNVIAYQRLSQWSMQSVRNPSDLSPMLWHVYCSIGHYQWTKMSESDQRRAFDEYYRVAVEMAIAGHNFREPDALQKIEHIQKPAADQETALAAISEMKGIIK